MYNRNILFEILNENGMEKTKKGPNTDNFVDSMCIVMKIDK